MNSRNGTLPSLLVLFAVFLAGIPLVLPVSGQPMDLPARQYWMVLYRQSLSEALYFGVPGNPEHSVMTRLFRVKTGIPGERPTPLPELTGRPYWTIISKEAQPDNPETAPYFLTLDVPAPDVPPYGPEPYTECGGQCDWQVAGPFGLHGVAGDPGRLSAADPGSSGCVRHTDADITYLYQVLDPVRFPVRYYVEER